MRRFPLTTVLILVTAFALWRVFAPTKVIPLESTPGFDDAVAFIIATYPTAVVVVPPLQTQALDKLPAKLVATDAVPADKKKSGDVVFLRRVDEELIPELWDERIMTHPFGEVRVDHIDRAP